MKSFNFSLTTGVIFGAYLQLILLIMHPLLGITIRLPSYISFYVYILLLLIFLVSLELSKRIIKFHIGTITLFKSSLRSFKPLAFRFFRTLIISIILILFFFIITTDLLGESSSNMYHNADKLQVNYSSISLILSLLILPCPSLFKNIYVPSVFTILIIVFATQTGKFASIFLPISLFILSYDHIRSNIFLFPIRSSSFRLSVYYFMPVIVSVFQIFKFIFERFNQQGQFIGVFSWTGLIDSSYSIPKFLFPFYFIFSYMLNCAIVSMSIIETILSNCFHSWAYGYRTFWIPFAFLRYIFDSQDLNSIASLAYNEFVKCVVSYDGSAIHSWISIPGNLVYDFGLLGAFIVSPIYALFLHFLSSITKTNIILIDRLSFIFGIVTFYTAPFFGPDGARLLTCLIIFKLFSLTRITVISNDKL